MKEVLQISSALSQPFMIDINFAQGNIALVDAFLSGKLPKLERKPLILSAFDPSQASVYELPAYDNGVDVLNEVEADSTVIIPIQGSLMKHDYCGDFGMMSLAQLVTQAAENQNVKSIVLHIESPGGSADGSLDLAMAVAYAASKKQTVAYIDGIGASAAYRVAAASSYIIAKPQSIIGSIGTMWAIRNNDQQLENLGIKEIVATADGSPDKNKDYFEAKAGNLTLIKESTLNPLNDAFIAEVKNFRKDVSADALTGKVFDSAKAKQLGLIDAEGMLADAINYSRNNSSQKQSSNMNFKIPEPIKQFFGFGEAEQKITQEHLDQLAPMVSENTELKQSVETLKTEKADLEQKAVEFNKTITELTAKNTELEQKVAEYGAMPGALPTQVDKKSDDFKQDTPKGYVPQQAQDIVNQFSK